MDDGKGFIDMGLDCVYTFNENGDLVGDYDGAWVGIDGWNVAYYFEEYYQKPNGSYYYYGRVPVLLNGERANLIILHTESSAAIIGARYDYQGETDAVAKGVTELNQGDIIEFIADYYSYSGVYEDTYVIGHTTYSSSIAVTDLLFENQSKVSAVYLFTDIYGNEYWTPEMNK